MDHRRSAVPALSPTILRIEPFEPSELARYFEQSWALTEALFSGLADDAAFDATPDPLRHPLLFYYAHPATFYVNKLRIVGLLEAPVRAGYEVLFAQGVDPERPSDLSRRRNWPKLEEVRAYRRAVHAVVAGTIGRLRAKDRVDAEDPEWALLMGVEHERIHFETSSVLFRQLACASLRRPEGFRNADTAASGREAGFVEISPGEVILGRPDASPTYGWDDEYGRREARVEGFEVGRTLVTNRDFLAFVEDAGYSRSELWSGEGWRWRTEARARAPKFWVATEDGLRYRATFDLLPFPLHWPVEVNCHEAQAYCRWLGGGYRLPTEAEWARILSLSGARASAEAGESYNLHLHFGTPTPVGAMDDDRDAPVYDVRGNVWQWLSDDFRPFSGFLPHLLYPDYSAPFFGRAHAVLRGGAWATTGAAATPHYRLWFRRHFFQHAGFRVAKSDLG
jgi:5-histidylcysteine sulfoxide synthase